MVDRDIIAGVLSELLQKSVADVIFHQLLRMDPRAVRSVLDVSQKWHAQHLVFLGNGECVQSFRNARPKNELGC